MNVYKTRLLESYGDFNEGDEEVFILPSTIPVDNATHLLGCIKNRTWGRWKRLKREVLSVEPLVDVASIQEQYRLKFISVSLEQEEDQIFIFSNTVDHDTMYEIITSFEDGPDGEDTGFRFKLGAGFTDMKTCWGRSATLDLMCREPEDTDLLKTILPL